MCHRALPVRWAFMAPRQESRALCKTGMLICCLTAWMFSHFCRDFAGFVPAMTGASGGRSRTAVCSQSMEGSAIPPLRYLGDPELMQPQPKVKELVKAEEFQSRLKILREAMRTYGGIGIAAPQIGWWVRAMCFGIEDGNPRYPAAPPVPFQYWINPEITWFSKEREFIKMSK